MRSAACQAPDLTRQTLQTKKMPRQPSGWMRGRGGFLVDQLGAVHEAAVRVQVCDSYLLGGPQIMCCQHRPALDAETDVTGPLLLAKGPW